MLSRATSSSDILQCLLLGSGSVVNIAEQCPTVCQMWIGSAAVVLMILWGDWLYGYLYSHKQFMVCLWIRCSKVGSSPTASLHTCLLDLTVGSSSLSVARNGIILITLADSQHTGMKYELPWLPSHCVSLSQ